jgi:hypothetical protein
MCVLPWTLSFETWTLNGAHFRFAALQAYCWKARVSKGAAAMMQNCAQSEQGRAKVDDGFARRAEKQKLHQR